MAIDPIKTLRKIRTKGIFSAGFQKAQLKALELRDEAHYHAGEAAAGSGKSLGDAYAEYWEQLEGEHEHADDGDAADNDVADADEADVDDADNDGERLDA